MKEKSMKWATLGAIFFPLAAYVYVGRRWKRGILVTLAGSGIGMVSSFIGGMIVGAINSDIAYYLFGVVVFAAVIAFLIWVIRDVRRLTRAYNEALKHS